MNMNLSEYYLSELHWYRLFENEWSQTATLLMAGFFSFVLCVSRVNSLSGRFLTAGSVDNDGALCRPPNQCCFSYTSSGWADLITQRCCILDCAVKYSCHVVRWWGMVFVFLCSVHQLSSFGFCRLICCTDEHQREEQNVIKLFFSSIKSEYFIAFLFWVLCIFRQFSSHRRQIVLKLNALDVLAQIMSLDMHYLAILISFSQTRLQFSFLKLCFVALCTEHSLFLWCMLAKG